MSFEDLPDNIREIPLTDSTLIADVLDLFVSMQDRLDGALLLLLCDEERRILQPIMVHEIEVAPPPDTVEMLTNLMNSVQHAFPGATALMAVARPGRLRVFPGDDRWARSIEQAASGRVPLIGVHLITPTGSLPISEPEAA